MDVRKQQQQKLLFTEKRRREFSIFFPYHRVCRPLGNDPFQADICFSAIGVWICGFVNWIHARHNRIWFRKRCEKTRSIAFALIVKQNNPRNRCHDRFPIVFDCSVKTVNSLRICNPMLWLMVLWRIQHFHFSIYSPSVQQLKKKKTWIKLFSRGASTCGHSVTGNIYILQS